MNELERIVCGADFSEYAPSAAGWAALLARFCGGAEVVLLHVSGPGGPGGAPRSLMEWVRPSPPREDVLRQLSGLAGPLAAAGTRVRPLVAEGHPVRQILEVAATESAGLIVIGTHGIGGYERMVLGSVTEKVLRKADRPVLSVPLGEALPPAAVVAAIDFSPASLTALDWAVSLAATAGATLALVHVLEQLPEEDPPEQAHFSVPEYRAHLTRDARVQLTAVARERAGRLEPELLVVSGSAWRQILRLAGERQAGLIVIGASGLRPSALGFLGSTASHLARSARCPLLTVR